jgi:enoyl-CoA hydratase/carnithine racemase
VNTIRHELVDEVLYLELNRPDKRNALNDDMFDELVAATESARDDSTVAAVVLSGSGKSFCAGLDFSVHQQLADEGATGKRPFADPDDAAATGGRRPGRGQRIVRALRDCPAPVIAAMHGHAIGGGLQMALGADIRIATSDMLLGCGEIDFGMTLDMGGSQLLPRLIGTDRAMDLMLSGRRITGAQAYEWGLVTRVSSDPVAEAVELAKAIAKRNRNAIHQTKRLVRLSAIASVEDGMKAELSVMAENIGCPAQVKAAHEFLASRRR